MSIMHNGEKVLNNLTTVPITQTINTSSTDKEIPSAKAVYDKISDSVLGIEITASNYSQFDSSILNWDCGVYVIGMTSTAQLINDLPQLVGGTLYITSISKTYETESLKYRQYRYITFGGNEFIRSMEYQSGSATYDTGWCRVCTTKVADVPKTTLTVNSWASGNVYYCVKNGICYVHISSLLGTTMSTYGQVIANGLPKPIFPGEWHSISAGLTTGGTLLVQILDNGAMCNYIGSNNVSYFGSFSYPIAES